MGGDSFVSSPSSTEEESLLGQDFTHESFDSFVSSGDEEGLSDKVEKGSAIKSESRFGEFRDVNRRISSIHEAAEKRRLKVYAEVLKSYEELESRIDKLEEMRNTILSYYCGSWADKAWVMDLSEDDMPDVPSLLLIGPKSSGKSSLVNKISRVLEDDVSWVSGRAQVSHNSSPGEGTYFLHEYMVPRSSNLFCIYDTRSLSVYLSENQKMLRRWMTKGVRHGELIKRKSDSSDLKAQLKSKARRSHPSSQYRDINFVIFVVDALSVLESMDSVDENKKQYSEMIAANFNNPLLSFRDDKPAVVVTHGDLLSLSDRVRIRVYLGDLLGVPPTTQIFDIPENDDSTTTLAIFDMLMYSLERAERNLAAPVAEELFVDKVDQFMDKVDQFMDKVYWVLCLFFWVSLATVILFGFRGFNKIHRPTIAKPQLDLKVEPPLDLDDMDPPLYSGVDPDVAWHKIRHVW